MCLTKLNAKKIKNIMPITTDTSFSINLAGIGRSLNQIRQNYNVCRSQSRWHPFKRDPFPRFIYCPTVDRVNPRLRKSRLRFKNWVFLPSIIIKPYPYTEYPSWISLSHQFSLPLSTFISRAYFQRHHQPSPSSPSVENRLLDPIAIPPRLGGKTAGPFIRPATERASF